MDNSLNALDTARELRKRGLFPVLIEAPSRAVPGPKKPLDGERWGKRALHYTPSYLSAMYGANANAGVGLLLGPEAGVIDLEIDGGDGEASLTRLFEGGHTAHARLEQRAWGAPHLPVRSTAGEAAVSCRPPWSSP